MLIKIHNSYRMIVAICDNELLGKKFEEGNLQLDLTGTFFKGENKTDEEVLRIIIDALKEDATINAVGDKSCDFLVGIGVVKKDSIKKIDGVSFTMHLI